MKNLFTTTFIIAFFSFSSFSQLEVIDKIAEVLIPGITNGVKEVLDSRDGGKVKKEEVIQLKEELLKKSSEILSKLDSDASNIASLNSIFETTGKLGDDIGGMKALSNTAFLDQVIATNSHELQKQIAIMFYQHYNQLKDKKDKLVSVNKKVADKNLRDKIALHAATIDKNLINLQTYLGLVNAPKASMTIEEAKSYVTNLKNTTAYLANIDDAIFQINIILNSRIESFNESLNNAKKKMDKELEDAKESDSEKK